MPVILTAAAVVIAVSLGLWGYDRWVNPRNRIDPASIKGMRFPQVTGSSLSGQEFNLPGDIEAEYALVMIAFQQVHQLDVNTWIPTALDASKRYSELVYYEFPTISRLNPLARTFIDSGMRGGIPDPTARATTITLYLDKPAFRKALDIPGENEIVIMLIDRTGEVLWRAVGAATQPALVELEEKLAKLFA
jgi:hypothetical protein